MTNVKDITYDLTVDNIRIDTLDGKIKYFPLIRVPSDYKNVPFRDLEWMAIDKGDACAARELYNRRRESTKVIESMLKKLDEMEKKPMFIDARTAKEETLKYLTGDELDRLKKWVFDCISAAIKKGKMKTRLYPYLCDNEAKDGYGYGAYSKPFPEEAVKILLKELPTSGYKIKYHGWYHKCIDISWEDADFLPKLK